MLLKHYALTPIFNNKLECLSFILLSIGYSFGRELVKIGAYPLVGKVAFHGRNKFVDIVS
jgi:hypothetical protein